MANNNLIDNVALLLDRGPEAIRLYTNYHYPNYQDISSNFYRRLCEIEKFLQFYRQKNLLEKPFNKITIEDLEQLPIETIQSYVSSSKSRNSSMRSSISYLSSFWSYFTIYSYTIERGKPIFYRHAFNEWKVAYSETYNNIKNSRKALSNQYQSYLDKNELIDLLDYIDNHYILTLETQKRADNWQRSKEKYLAAFALIIGTGITVEELAQLTIYDVDMRKKEIVVNREGISQHIPVLDFCVPYISQYMSIRRSQRVDNKRQPYAFLNPRGERVSTNFFTTIIYKVGKKYHRPLSASALKNSHAFVIYEETKDLGLSKGQQGLKTLTAFEKFI